MSRPAANSSSNRSGAGAAGGAAQGSSAGTPSVDSRAAALHGATRAFLPRSPSPSPPQGRGRGEARGGGAGQNHGGALAAASHAARARSPPGVAAAAPVSSGTSAARLTSPTRSAHTGQDPSLTAGRSAVARAVATAKAPQVAEEDRKSREQSPSHIAATLAAARAPATSSLPPSPHASEFVKPPTSPDRSSEDEVDRKGILTTKQLIRSFEANDGAADTGLTPPSPGPRTRSPPRAIISPVPLRPSIPLLASRKATEMFKPPVETKPSPPAPPKKPAALVRRTTQQSEPGSSKEVSQERSPRLPRSPRSPEESNATDLLEHRRGSRVIEPQSTLDALVDSDASSEESYTSAQDQLSRSSTRKSEPPVIKPKPALPSPEPTKQAAPPPPPQRPVPPRRPYSAVNYSVPDAPPLKPQLTADSLADAMVASSLAGSRVASPMRSALATPPPPRPWSSQARRGSRGLLQVTSNTSSNGPLISRTPSPFKGMRHTLRAEPSPSPSGGGGGASGGMSGDEQPYKPHHRRRIVRKHPHKHAEGDRRRWRDVVAEAERRRYEGVWAANRGILTASREDDVHGYVVRDIWTRSGLNQATLAQVWDLVADGGRLVPTADATRQLRRDEFVVGLWLVDQCLKGRRLPVEVGDSVWGSVRGLMPGLRGR